MEGTYHVGAEELQQRETTISSEKRNFTHKDFKRPQITT